VPALVPPVLGAVPPVLTVPPVAGVPPVVGATPPVLLLTAPPVAAWLPPLWLPPVWATESVGEQAARVEPVKPNVRAARGNENERKEADK
jgi:hypothetical protein